MPKNGQIHDSYLPSDGYVLNILSYIPEVDHQRFLLIYHNLLDAQLLLDSVELSQQDIDPSEKSRENPSEAYLLIKKIGEQATIGWKAALKNREEFKINYRIPAWIRVLILSRLVSFTEEQQVDNLQDPQCVDDQHDYEPDRLVVASSAP
jgi:hypothetical protein